jgi:hypothetical protein
VACTIVAGRIVKIITKWAARRLRIDLTTLLGGNRCDTALSFRSHKSGEFASGHTARDRAAIGHQQL